VIVVSIVHLEPLSVLQSNKKVFVAINSYRKVIKIAASQLNIISLARCIFNHSLISLVRACIPFFTSLKEANNFSKILFMDYEHYDVKSVDKVIGTVFEI
jgi:hypothetical protein